MGNASDFTGRNLGSPQVPSHPLSVPLVGHDVHKRPVDGLGRHPASLPVPARPARPSVRRSEGGTNPGCSPNESYIAGNAEVRVAGADWTTGPTEVTTPVAE
jgi:hypothetical protein